MDEDGVKSLGEALDGLIESVQKIDETNWGPWKLDRTTRKVYIAKPTAYDLSIDIDLAAGALVGTLHYMRQKTWVDNECLGGLARAAFAIREAVGDPFNTQNHQKGGTAHG